MTPAYYMLECYGPDEEQRASIDTVEDDGVNWTLAERLRVAPPNPVKVTLNANEGLMMPMFYASILIMSDELLLALRAAGVDNLDTYDATLFNPLMGKRFLDYKAVNIIGAIAVANLAQSECVVHGDPKFDVDFDALAIDAAKARGLSMFRLAECVTGIVVHERVKRRVEEAGIPHLDWVLPEDWVG